MTGPPPTTIPDDVRDPIVTLRSIRLDTAGFWEPKTMMPGPLVFITMLSRMMADELSLTSMP